MMGHDVFQGNAERRDCTRCLPTESSSGIAFVVVRYLHLEGCWSCQPKDLEK